MVRQKGKLPPEAADFVVNDWIGFHGISLAHFTHGELTEFFRRYTDLPDWHPGVTDDGTSKHARLKQALDHGSARQQAEILRAILSRLPVAPTANRTQEGADRIHAWIHDLEEAVQGRNVDVDLNTASIPVGLISISAQTC